MSFFKKLGETVKDTASTIGAKSADLVETGKLKLQRSQLENGVKEKKTEIGHLVYQAHQQNSTLSIEDLTPLFTAIQELEKQIAAVDEKLHKEVEKEAQPSVATPAPSQEKPGTSVFCSQCGQELSAEAKFCNKCGHPQ